MLRLKNIKWKLAQWLELRWWKNYLNKKNKKDYLVWKRQYWQQLLVRISRYINLDDPLKICDLGCGPAGVFISLPHNSVTAVDPLIDKYENQIPFFKKADYVNTVFYNSLLEDFVYEQKFDVVFCMNCINHVRDIEKGFAKLKELCAENGTVVVSIDAHNFNLFKYLFRLIPGDALHPHQYSLHEYLIFLQKNNMQLLNTELIKKEFFFTHYLIVAKHMSNF